MSERSDVKIGFVSDIHCNVVGLRAALDLLADCDQILCAGDLMLQYRFSNEVPAVLSSAGVQSIVGNHDKTILHVPNHPLRSSPAVESRWLQYVSELPDRLTVDVQGVRIVVTHGAPWDAAGAIESTYVYPHDDQRLARMREVDADVVVLGHTHVPMIEQVGSVRVLNPGSCGIPSGATPQVSCAVLNLDTLDAQVLHFAP